jgi:hypothetical protein
VAQLCSDASKLHLPALVSIPDDQIRDEDGGCDQDTCRSGYDRGR